jgi:hypothetical protein
MKKIIKNFPIYSIKNFYTPLWPFWNKQDIIESVIYNKKYHIKHEGNNFPILEDNTNFFKHLYEKYYDYCLNKFKFIVHPKNVFVCWAYISKKDDFSEVWHDHIKTSTISAVYYLSIPKNKTSIDFCINQNYFNYEPSENELIIFPNYLEHKPNRCYNDGYRISINMEILSFQNSEDLFNLI